MLTAKEAEAVASLMTAVDGDEDIDVDDEMKQAPLVAAAALLACARLAGGEHGNSTTVAVYC